MSAIGLDFRERNPRARGVERVHQRARLRGRKQPVAGERHHAEPGLDAAERLRQHAVMIGGDVEIVHRPRQIQIAVGVEALDKGRALIAQIALDLEIGVERECRQVAVLHPPAELAMQRCVREIGDMRGHPRDAEAAMRMGALFEVAPVVPVRIGHHGLPTEFVERDVLRRMPRAAGDRQRREHPLGIGRGPLQRLHAAHRAADDAEQRVDAQTIEQHGLRAHHVGNGDDRKIQPPQFAGGRIGRGRPGRAHAAADHIGADDEVAVGVERTAGADHGLPPARLAGHRMHVGDVLIAGQRMADQNGVGTVGVEFAIGLVGDLERREIDAAIERQRLVDAEQCQLRTRMVRLVRPLLGMDRRTWYRLHVYHFDYRPPSGGPTNHHGNQAKKNPA